MSRRHMEHRYKDSIGLRMLKNLNYEDRYFDSSLRIHSELEERVKVNSTSMSENSSNISGRQHFELETNDLRFLKTFY